MSSYADLELRCKRRLGRRGMTITSEFLDEMIAAQERLERGPALPRFLKKTVTITTAANSPVLTGLPPSDFIRVYDDAALTYIDSSGNEKKAARVDMYDQLRMWRNRGVPTDCVYYFIDTNTNIEINAQPTDVDFTFTYYAKDAAPNTDNLWTTHQGDLIMAMAGTELAAWLRDDRALQYFTNVAQHERVRMVKQIEADEWGDTDLIMGGRN